MKIFILFLSSKPVPDAKAVPKGGFAHQRFVQDQDIALRACRQKAKPENPGKGDEIDPKIAEQIRREQATAMQTTMYSQQEREFEYYSKLKQEKQASMPVAKPAPASQVARTSPTPSASPQTQPRSQPPSSSPQAPAQAPPQPRSRSPEPIQPKKPLSIEPGSPKQDQPSSPPENVEDVEPSQSEKPPPSAPPLIEEVPSDSEDEVISPEKNAEEIAEVGERIGELNLEANNDQLPSDWVNIEQPRRDSEIARDMQLREDTTQADADARLAAQLQAQEREVIERENRQARVAQPRGVRQAQNRQRTNPRSQQRQRGETGKDGNCNLM